MDRFILVCTAVSVVKCILSVLQKFGPFLDILSLSVPWLITLGGGGGKIDPGVLELCF
jgi:hypothetical protein